MQYATTESNEKINIDDITLSDLKKRIKDIFCLLLIKTQNIEDLKNFKIKKGENTTKNWIREVSRRYFMICRREKSNGNSDEEMTEFEKVFIKFYSKKLSILLKCII